MATKKLSNHALNKAVYDCIDVYCNDVDPLDIEKIVEKVREIQAISATKKEVAEALFALYKEKRLKMRVGRTEVYFHVVG